jgi:hypothetical protein
VTERGETTTQATKRKHEQASQQLATYEQLFSMIQTQDERSVTEIIRWIRSGHTADSIVRRANTGVDFAMLDPERHAFDIFLVNLAHSTGSLRQILRLAMSVSTRSPRAEPPDPQRLHMLCNRIVHFSYMENMLHMPQTLSPVSCVLLNQAEQPSSADTYSTIAIQDEYPRDGAENSDDVPPHRVPAVPWTTITSDDGAVSHLISLFLAWNNPGWRYVEADIFLKGTPELCTDHPFIEPCSLLHPRG